ncbi:MAG TPA: plastocyanin/azurin family copper-binding protein [Solirubrobacteraceae bacterium]|nr:plastocyanin/azurin family copper-binding protein [Solirubrobacteraceae bacterium]
MKLSRDDRRPLSAGVAAAFACCGLLLAGGCGSSGASSTAASTPGTASTGARLTLSKTPKYASPPASAPVRSGVVQIAYRNITIAPDTVRVKAGTTVIWTNYDSVEHNVTSQGGRPHLASGNFVGGTTFEAKFTRPAVIHYLCTIHPTTMNGTIEVVK